MQTCGLAVSGLLTLPPDKGPYKIINKTKAAGTGVVLAIDLVSSAFGIGYYCCLRHGCFKRFNVVACRFFAPREENEKTAVNT